MRKYIVNPYNYIYSNMLIQNFPKTSISHIVSFTPINQPNHFFRYYKKYIHINQVTTIVSLWS